jgi:VIT1/CCC1 family predicted Fe2+/Mn2+ transporter
MLTDPGRDVVPPTSVSASAPASVPAAQRGGHAQRLNWLRAGVLGANDGIVSVAAVLVGVASATQASAPILTAGVATLVGGAISMALGEYVSVSSQRDSERAFIERERALLATQPERQLEELAEQLQTQGLSAETARLAAIELSDRDALGAQLAAKLNIDSDDIASPWHAALASAAAFFCGGIFPLLAVLLLPIAVRIPIVFVAVLAALAITGAVGARVGGASVWRATLRVVIGGALALGATFTIGALLGTAGVL